MPKKKTKHVLEDPQQISTTFVHADRFLQRHRRWVAWIGATVGVWILAFFGYRYYKDTQNEEAQRELFQAVYYFEEDSMKRALEGDGINYGFLELIEQYPGTKASNLARFYAGVCYLKLEQYTEAISQLEDFNSSDWFVQARAYALLGDAYMEQEKYKEAAKYYEEAADYKPSKQFSPQYLKKAAVAYEKLNNTAKALDCYLRMTKKHAGSLLQEEAEKHIQRLGGGDIATYAP